MRPTRFLLPLVLAGWVLAPSAAMARAHMPDFRDIEYHLTGEDALAAGQVDVRKAIAVGSPLTDGVLVLRGAGATCKPDRRSSDMVRCLYNQMSSDGDALAEVRWTTILNSQNGRVTDVSVNREVDTRMTN